MTILQIMILSLIEGITEFLPISSTGHLILASRLLNIPVSDFTKSFEIFIQLGAILAVLVIFLPQLRTQSQVIYRIMLSFMPTALIGFVFYKPVKAFLIGNSAVTLVSLLIGGVVLMVIDYFIKSPDRKIADLKVKHFLIIGLFQAISIVPGVSRSAATIIGFLLLGINRKEAVEYSFLLAIPTMIAASGYDMFKSAGTFTGADHYNLLIGFLTAFASATVAVKYFISYVKQNSLKIFGLYRIVLAIVFTLTIGI